MSKDQSENPTRLGSLLAVEYPDDVQWGELLKTFDAKAVAHKLLLAHVPYVFRSEPLKFALFRKTIADAFDVEPTSVFIVGSAMAGRSLKGSSIKKPYSSESDIDTLIVSESLFARYLMASLQWVADITKPSGDTRGKTAPRQLSLDESKHVGMFAVNASRGIWRPDSLPKSAVARKDFFDRFSDVSLKTLGLQLSDDTVAKVNGRVARSFHDAVTDLAGSLRRLKFELAGSGEEAEGEENPVSGLAG
jgi:hypothetical protein